MSIRPTPPVARTLSRLHRWLRDTWLGRIDLTGWVSGWHEWLFEFRGATTKRKPSAQLDLQSLETRMSPDDPIGIGLMVLGMPLMTPMTVLLQGWSGGQAGGGLAVTRSASPVGSNDYASTLLTDSRSASSLSTTLPAAP